MRHVFSEGKWTWFDYDFSSHEQLEELAEEYPTCQRWYDGIKGYHTNNLRMDTSIIGKEALWGSLVYRQDINHKDQKDIFHFYLTKKFLITYNFKIDVLDELDAEAVYKKMHQSDNPIEGFLILIGEIISHFLQKIDDFEMKLRELLWEIKEENGTDILDKIADSRHELLVWKNLLIPITEIRMGVEEAFGEDTSSKVHFQRACKRIERAQTLISEYGEELTAMVDLENNVSSHRGNEIMKTLTVLTTLFTPVTAWGAVWGMNFKHMPELEWEAGYLFSWAAILISTFIIYIYLRKKGWMGDLLKSKRKNSFFK
ncbi:magnesium transporter CorA family protein [Bacillus xiapuensis]|uniref:magnesium transporter CorA family protein n=1 Tax=Bacillus xiapuensis TaxID=2014075 RepID=UPI000C243AFB|nr:magnesium transporter CorA family protein [Bacillus xiapuensis]